MEWLFEQAKGAGGFISVACLLIVGVQSRVIVVLWKQLLFERKEHREGEKSFTMAVTQTAVAMEKLAGKRLAK